MESENGPKEPRRLMDAPDGLGHLLRAADDDFSKGLNEPKAFRALERRRERSVRVRRAVLAASAAGALAAMVVRLTTAGDMQPSAVLVTPEVFAPRAQVLASASPRREVAEPPVLSAEVPPSQSSAGVPAASGDSLFTPKPARKASRAVAAKPDRRTESGCRELAQAQGHSTEAQLSCLEVVAEGSGLAAEAALFEIARLNARAQPQRALENLAEHRERFPDGALRGEVAELRIRLLYQLRRDQEALAESEQALGTPWGRVLSSKLHLLRGKIYDERLSDCGRAVPEYVALVGEAGPEADDAEFRRAACLERLGRSAEAITAYESYLRRGEPRRGAAALEALVRLGRAVD